MYLQVSGITAAASGPAQVLRDSGSGPPAANDALLARAGGLASVAETTNDPAPSPTGLSP